MRWGALWVGGLVACGPAVIVGEDTSTDEDTESTTGSSSTSGPDATGSSSGPGPFTSSTTTTSATEGSSSSSSDGPFVPDVPAMHDCYDDECPPGQWCGPAHNQCRPMDVVEPCAGEPAHGVVEVGAVLGMPVAIRVADLDGDLDHDTIVLADAMPAIAVVLQDGGAVPLAPQPLALVGPRAVDIGDLDGDAIVDVAVATATAVHWAPGLGDGTFGAWAEFVSLPGAQIAGFGLGRAGIEDPVSDAVLFVAEPPALYLAVNGGTGAADELLETQLDTDISGAFVAMDRGFNDAIALVGASGTVRNYVPADKTLVLESSSSTLLTNADAPIVDVDLAPVGGGVHTFGFVNLQGWTYGGYLTAQKAIETTSRMIVGSGSGGFDYALVTDDDRVLVVEGCYDTHDLGGVPIAADAGDLDADGRGDLAFVVNGLPLTFLLSGH